MHECVKYTKMKTNKQYFENKNKNKNNNLTYPVSRLGQVPVGFCLSNSGSEAPGLENLDPEPDNPGQAHLVARSQLAPLLPRFQLRFVKKRFFRRRNRRRRRKVVAAPPSKSAELSPTSAFQRPSVA
jgi:hypothetical protein